MTAHRTLAKALIAQGWNLVRLEQALREHAHAVGDPARAATGPRLSRIVNGRAAPTRAQSVGIYAVLLGAPSPIAWDPAFVAGDDDVPEPAQAPPDPGPTLSESHGRRGRR